MAAQLQLALGRTLCLVRFPSNTLLFDQGLMSRALLLFGTALRLGPEVGDALLFHPFKFCGLEPAALLDFGGRPGFLLLLKLPSEILLLEASGFRQGSFLLESFLLTRGAALG